MSFGAAFGDLNGDGNLDLVYSNYKKGVTVLRNDADSGHRIIIALRGIRSNHFGIGCTVRIETDAGVQVRTLVLARGVLSSSEPVVHFGLGVCTRVRRMTVSWPSGHEQAFADLSADRRFTVTEPAEAVSPHAPAPPVRAQFSDVSRDANFALLSRESVVDETVGQTLLPMRQNRRGPALAIGDLMGLGRDDVVLGGTPADPARILAAADGRFLPGPGGLPNMGGTLNDGPILVFDADGDGTNDLLVTKGGSSSPPGRRNTSPSFS